MKVRYWIYFLFGLCTIWLIGAKFVDNVYIIPFPTDVFLRMIEICTNFVFYQSLFMTFFRASVSIIFSFFFASIFAYWSVRFYFLEFILEKLVLILRAIPNVTYIILLLFWVSREASVYIVSFLLLFPVLFQILFDAIMNIQKEWNDVLLIYPQDHVITLTRIYLPLMKPAIRSSLINACSLAFKVGIMGEILSSVSIGIGRQMQLARLDVDLTSVLAWTIWLMIFVFSFDFFIKRFINYIFR